MAFLKITALALMAVFFMVSAVNAKPDPNKAEPEEEEAEELEFPENTEEEEGAKPREKRFFGALLGPLIGAITSLFRRRKGK